MRELVHGARNSNLACIGLLPRFMESPWQRDAATNRGDACATQICIARANLDFEMCKHARALSWADVWQKAEGAAFASEPFRHLWRILSRKRESELDAFAGRVDTDGAAFCGSHRSRMFNHRRDARVVVPGVVME